MHSQTDRHGRAQVAKLVDAAGLGPAAARCGGSIPFLGTSKHSADKRYSLVEKVGCADNKLGFLLTRIDRFTAGEKYGGKRSVSNADV